MRALRVVALLGMLLAACTASSLSTPSPTASATVAASASPISNIAAEVGPFAAVCGMISEFVADGALTNGALVLNSPGRAPLRITIPAGRLGGSASGYACVGVLAGAPYPLFNGFFPQGARGRVQPGAIPATSASPAPTGFVLPQACAYVVPPVISADQTDWKVDCGAANNNARGTLGAALAQQGWASCGTGLATAHWRKNDVMLAIAESSLAPGDYPRLTQLARVVSPCS
jgi:hypothetical protein